MCVIFFYINSNPSIGGYKLILASNRDEFYARKTRRVTKWTTPNHDEHQHNNVYGGIDLEPGREGGTWLAIGADKNVIKIAALLNLTGEPKPRNSIVQNNSNNCTNHHQHHQHHHHHHHHYHQQQKQQYAQHNHSNANTNTNTSTFISNSTNNCTQHKKIENAAATKTKTIITTTTTTTTNGTISHKQQQIQQEQPQNNNNFLLGRGMLVADFVSSRAKLTIEKYNKNLMKDCEKYNAFNFVSIEIRDKSKGRIMLCSNVPPTINSYDEGKCYGFGNSLPEQPFQKVHHGTLHFERIVQNFLKQQNVTTTTATATAAAVAAEATEIEKEQKLNLITEILDLLKCKHKYWPDAELARRAPNWGEHLSAIDCYVPHEKYGSRTHSVILIDGNNQMTFVEETMSDTNPDGVWHKTCIEKQLFDANTGKQKDKEEVKE